VQGKPNETFVVLIITPETKWTSLLPRLLNEIDPISDCSNNLEWLKTRGEIPIELRASWLTTKTIKVVILLQRQTWESTAPVNPDLGNNQKELNSMSDDWWEGQ
jgi:hypothetical protein